MTTQRKESWQARLAAERASLLELLAKLTPEQWQTPVFGDGESWTVATVVAHLIDGERGMSIQIHKTRKGEETIPEGFDLNRWNAGVAKRMGDLSPAELLAALDATRARTIEGLATLRDDEWARTGRHPSRGVITIEQYYETIAGHDRQHASDIRRALGLAEA